MTNSEMINNLHNGHLSNIRKMNDVYIENIESCINSLECIPYTTKEDWTSYGDRITQVIQDLTKLREFGLSMIEGAKESI